MFFFVFVVFVPVSFGSFSIFKCIFQSSAVLWTYFPKHRIFIDLNSFSCEWKFCNLCFFVCFSINGFGLYYISLVNLCCVVSNVKLIFIFCCVSLKLLKFYSCMTTVFFGSTSFVLNFSLILNPNIFHVWNNADVFASWGLCLDRTV